MCSGDFKLHKEGLIQGGKERNVIDSTENKVRMDFGRKLMND